MRTLTKRVLSIALALCLCLVMLTDVVLQANAADAVSMMVSWAKERVGKTGQQLGYNDEWCAYFVSDCANYAGQSKAVPYNGNAHYLYFDVLDAGGKVVSSPQAGDLVFYNCTACDTNGDGISMMHVGLVENGSYTIEGNLDGSSYSTRTVKRKGLGERYSHGSGHSTDNYVKRVYVRPAYDGVTTVAPEKPTITTTTAYYAEGGDIAISWNAVVGNTYYWINVYKDGELIVNQSMGNETTYTLEDVAKGEYTFAVSANNSIGTSGGTQYSFLVGMAPEKPKLSMEQDNYIEGETATVSWAPVVGNTYYWINVYKNGELIVDQSVENSTYYTMVSLSAGKYMVYVSANNAAGTSGSSSLVFTVTELPAPVLSAQQTVYKTGETVRISWNKVDKAAQYTYYLSEYPEGYAYTTNVSCANLKETSVEFKDLPNGRYCMFVHAISEAGISSAQSNWITFYVYNYDYIPIKTIESNGHIYSLYDCEASWDFAKLICDEMGGHLATVTSAEENAIVTNLIECGGKDAYWLGAHNADPKNFRVTGMPFVWITGEDFEFANWLAGEPSQSGEDGNIEHFLEIRKSYDSKWNDVANCNRQNKGFILEIETTAFEPVASTQYGDSQYLLFNESIPWTEARAYCESIGGHLATISSVEEDAAVYDLIQRGQDPWYFLGALEENGEWSWVDGNKVPLTGEYANWGNTSGQAQKGPSGWGSFLMKYQSTGMWIGIQNFYPPGSEMSKLGFVCEMDRNVIPGDINGDGRVNAQDRLLLTRYLAKWTGYKDDMVDMVAADVNCDGKVNAQDRLILTRYLAKWSGYETLPHKG